MTVALRSGQVATAAGVNPETLRYYERRGLLAEPHRSPGGHRMYPPEAVTVLRVIKAAQRLGFTLDEVAGLLAAGGHRHPPARPRTATDRDGRTGRTLQAGVAEKLAEIEAKITDLQVMRAALLDAEAAGCDDLLACAAEESCPLPFAELDRTTLAPT